MTRYQLFKIALAASGTKLVDLAKEWGIKHPSLVQVSQGCRRSRRLENKIDIWTSRVLASTGIAINRKPDNINKAA